MPAPQERAKPAEQGASEPATAAFLTAKEACTQLTASARQWADDARPYKLEGKADQREAAVTDGKCSTWRVWFSSPGKKGDLGLLLSKRATFPLSGGRRREPAV